MTPHQEIFPLDLRRSTGTSPIGELDMGVQLAHCAVHSPAVWPLTAQPLTCLARRFTSSSVVLGNRPVRQICCDMRRRSVTDSDALVGTESMGTDPYTGL